jgi:hypothetical protein
MSLIQDSGNPFGEPREKRAAWTEGLEVPAFERGMDYLYWPCCVPSLDTAGVDDGSRHSGRRPRAASCRPCRPYSASLGGPRYLNGRHRMPQEQSALHRAGAGLDHRASLGDVAEGHDVVLHATDGPLRSWGRPALSRSTRPDRSAPHLAPHPITAAEGAPLGLHLRGPEGRPAVPVGAGLQPGPVLARHVYIA